MNKRQELSEINAELIKISDRLQKLSVDENFLKFSNKVRSDIGAPFEREVQDNVGIAQIHLHDTIRAISKSIGIDVIKV